MVTIKKYSNRRLYDTSSSGYITLEELAEKIRSGVDVRVVHAKTEEDITQEVLAQIILESRGAARLLPVPLLVRLIRMGEDRLAEFFGQFMSWSLELYLQFKERAETMTPYNPFGGNTGKMFSGPEAFFRMFLSQSPWGGSQPWNSNGGASIASSAEPPPIDEEEPREPPPESTEEVSEEQDVESLRDEIDELKEIVRSMAEEQSPDAKDAD